jgi:hypothetical protein
VVTGKADAEAVDEQSLTAAIALIDYFKARATGVYARLRSTQADQRAEQARRWSQSYGDSCMVRDLQRFRVAGVRRASEADKLVCDLLDLGHGQMVKRQLPSGRTQRVFVLHNIEVS